jgi:hypothetical protein
VFLCGFNCFFKVESFAAKRVVDTLEFKRKLMAVGFKDVTPRRDTIQNKPPPKNHELDSS